MYEWKYFNPWQMYYLCNICQFIILLCVLMVILPFLVIPSKRSYRKIISLFLQNSEDNVKTFARTRSVKCHHDGARLSLPGVAMAFDSLQSVPSFSHLLYLIAVHFSVEHDMMSLAMSVFIDTDLPFSFPFPLCHLLLNIRSYMCGVVLSVPITESSNYIKRW